MRKLIFCALALVLAFFLLSLFLTVDKTPVEKTPSDESPAPAITRIDELQSGTSLRVLQNGAVVEMDANQYLWGVVAAEMPASFEPEALKAQAVAARTYAISRAQWTNQKHPDADVCGDHRCCQAYITPEKAASNWGDNAAAHTQKILNAVYETGREVLLYEDKLISAVFHSSSSGMTQDAVQVWGGSTPYLQPVESPEGEGVPNFETELRLSPADFKKRFLAKYPEAVLEGEPSSWFSEPECSPGGAVIRMSVGGVSVRGVDLRSLLSLRSASFTVAASNEEIVFSVRGYGHGVGMSQYGANTLAKEGKSYREVLLWYYSGVALVPCPDALWLRQAAGA